MTPKKLLYLSHRWLGIAMCLLIAMWFASGMVMMYVGFPELTQDEYYAGLEPLAAKRINRSPEEILAGTSADTAIEQLLLTSSGKRPVYLLKQQAVAWQGLYADSGEPITELTAETAVAAAVNFYQTQHPGQTETGEYLQQLHMDQWSVSNGLNPYRPLHKIAVNDDAGTELYVSSLTGQVIRDTHRSERIWNWLGSNLHWIYPVQLRKHRSLWENVIIFLALLGLVSVSTGAIIGFMHLRLTRRYPNGSYSPYHGMLKYHHVIGLMALIFLSTFFFSGLMSIGPWGIFDSNSSFSEQRQRYQHKEGFLNSAPAYSKPEAIRQLIQQNKEFPVKQIAWHWIAGKSHVSLHASSHEVRYLLDPGDKESLQQRIDSRIGRLIPNSNIVSQQQLSSYDLYYYSHHNRHRPLPVLRIKFDDPEATWFHIDLASGRVLNRLTDRRRLERWIYNGLHSFDFTLLINNRPVWDLWMIFLCGVGLFFAVTSMVISVRYLRRKKYLF